MIKWQYFWNEPDAQAAKRDPEQHPLNKKCKMEVTIVEANFLKDSDVFGKMDPYVKFAYGRGAMQTRVAENAGKHAVFNEKFTLSNIHQQVEAGHALELQAMEKDVATSDLLGAAHAIPWAELCEYEGLLKHDVEVYNDKGQKCGNIVVKTQLRWVEYVPP